MFTGGWRKGRIHVNFPEIQKQERRVRDNRKYQQRASLSSWPSCSVTSFLRKAEGSRVQGCLQFKVHFLNSPLGTRTWLGWSQLWGLCLGFSTQNINPVAKSPEASLIVTALEMMSEECLPACKNTKGLHCEIRLGKFKAFPCLCVHNQRLSGLEVRYTAKRLTAFLGQKHF